jgi:hypothetical protein
MHAVVSASVNKLQRLNKEQYASATRAHSSPEATAVTPLHDE